MPLITSANVACGFHAGDPATAFATLALAAKHGVRVGAHPSFPDREHFGRRELERTEQQVYEDCVYQIGALAGLAQVVRHDAVVTSSRTARSTTWPAATTATPGRSSPPRSCSACR